MSYEDCSRPRCWAGYDVTKEDIGNSQSQKTKQVELLSDGALEKMVLRNGRRRGR